MANDAEVRRWNDPRWTSAWPAREVLTASLTPALLTALTVRPGQRVLDVGCGGGGLTIALAPMVSPGGHVVGADVSTDLLELASHRAAEAGHPEVVFVRVDMQEDRVGGPPFDLVVSQLGVMFFDEPVRAFANIGQHLHPRGQLVFVCWQRVDRNPWHIGTALGGLVTPPAPPGPGKSATGAFVLGPPEYTTEVLVRAGFVEIAFRSAQSTVRAPASAVVDRDLLGFMGVPPDRMGEAEAVIDRHLLQFDAGDGEFDFPLAFHVVTARRP
jgi:SAM-dependent methyltransferase